MTHYWLPPDSTVYNGILICLWHSKSEQKLEFVFTPATILCYQQQWATIKNVLILMNSTSCQKYDYAKKYVKMSQLTKA